MKIYNTLTGRKEKLIKPKGRPLQLFVCGPTVYDHSHIGHGRTYLAFDIFVRYLRFLGWRIFYLQNITNVEDRIIDRARRERKNPLTIARFFEKKYLEDIKSLKITSVNRYARASDFIPQIIRQIQTLKRKGYAYEAKDGYYFDIAKFSDYGKLSKRTAAQAEDAVTRIDESIHKRNKGDFALWKFVKTKRGREPAWDTPLGRGRPGWHIEDTAISESFFGPQYDVHGGAIDLKFPHHEAEISQQEAASGRKPFVKIWMHTGFLLVNRKKMSKSLKNFITIRDFLKKYPPEVFRWIVLSHHYRTPMNYTPDLASQARASLQTIQEFLEKLAVIIKHKSPKKSSSLPKSNVSKIVKQKEQSLHLALQDDLNTPEALAVIFSLISQFQKNVWSLPKRNAKIIKEFIESALAIFGLTLRPAKVPKKLQVLARRRELFRHNKQFTQADALRKKIKRVGYDVEDTPFGPFIRKVI